MVIVSPFQEQASHDEKRLHAPANHLQIRTNSNKTNLIDMEENKIICLEPNICKEDPTHEVYKYIRTDSFNRMLQGRIDVTHNITHDTNVIPNIVHFTWYGSKRKNIFRFHHLISVLSAHRFIKPSVIYFWCESVPEGDYFKEARTKVPELKLVYRLPPTEIYGQRVAVAEHVTDVVRLEALMEYGGIYFDLDAVAVKSPDDLLHYETVMGWESPSGLCNGIILSSPWANFLKIWHREYYSFQDRFWSYHSVRLPAELTKRYPGLIHTETASINRPNWSPQELAMLYKEGNIYDFKTKNYFVHLWFRQHGVDHNPRDIRTWNTTVGALFRHVYYGDDTIWPSMKDRHFKF
ncbi:uncharacterized protein LOC121374564 [Gigantopelta aegis]|uniref:uncharacterized protein LOC121374564 n=1 Tax=Gigantopelta aegis TaxID=1735272 RepID=UPI001B88CFD9|nr:uncharacterized protein LOC121374564 [Gigantopelta aegis]